MKWVYRCLNPLETQKLGEVIGQLVQGGELIFLEGELGAGKTVLAQGIAMGLDVNEPVNSPTFTLVNEYEGRLPMYHMDLYRLDDPKMLFDIGFEEYLYHDGITVIEWAEKAGPYLPSEYLQIILERESNDEDPEAIVRNLSVLAIGARHEQILKGMIAYAGTGT